MIKMPDGNLKEKGLTLAHSFKFEFMVSGPHHGGIKGLI